MPLSRPVLILAPFRRDGESIAHVLTERRLVTRLAGSMTGLAQEISVDTGAVVIAEEAFREAPDPLLAALSGQPAWSDIPFVVLRNRQAGGPSPFQLPGEIINVFELERPTTAASLSSAVVAALRARDKQFVIRDQLEELAESRHALASSEAELRLVADSLPVLIAFLGTDLRYRFANAAYEKWLGQPLSSIIGRHVREVVGEKEWEERKESLASALEGHAARFEVSWPRPDGQRRDVEIRYLPRFAQNGIVDGLHVFATDITMQKIAMEAKHQQAMVLETMVAERTAELQAQMRAREASEAALRQVQKMEAVGQLTGGLAHDFNNMLTGILTAMDLMRMRISDGGDDGMVRLIDVAEASAKRAAGLTQRLLTFSRRQSLNAKPVDVNALVESMEELITRTLTEQMALEVHAGEYLSPALVDTNQLENALLNLAINARDAMAGGGRLVIKTGMGSFPPGAHRTGTPCIELSVIDNGSGMSAEVRDHIFEPFFTTKPQGQGTGLGLSMVYGFMQQSGGHVAIDSVEGLGTTVTLYLPVANDAAKAQGEQATRSFVHGQGQRIVLVEDDDQVRELAVDVLAQLGYSVHPFSHPADAMEWFVGGGTAALLVTDVGLPGMNGRELTRRIRAVHPRLPVLFVTAYAVDALDQTTFLEEGMTMLTKPFSVSDLSRSVGAALSGDLGSLRAREH